jgi:hypothetical protein
MYPTEANSTPTPKPGLVRAATAWRLARLAAALAVSCGSVPAAAQGYQPRAEYAASGWRQQPQAMAAPKHEFELRAVEDVGEKIEAGRENVQDARIATERITDILVRLRPLVRTTRDPASIAAPERTTTAVAANLHIVTQGRISPAAVAQCDRFDGDILVCTVECEGGTFGLRRGRAPGEHYLMVGMPDMGRAASGAETTPQARGGFRLGACATRDTPALLLMPRGGRLASDIRLVEQP